MQIWKFPLDIEQDVALVEAPAEAQALSVQVQDGQTVVWMKVDPNEPTVSHYFRVIGTGDDVVHVGRFIDTVQVGGYVWHIFEDGPR